MSTWALLFIQLLICTFSVCCAGQEHCDAVNGDCLKTKEFDCSGTVKLAKLDEILEEENKIFFVESSDRPFLNQRQACSVESAVRANPGYAVVVAMTAEELDLAASNSTCQLYHKYRVIQELWLFIGPT